MIYPGYTPQGPQYFYPPQPTAGGFGAPTDFLEQQKKAQAEAEEAERLAVEAVKREQLAKRAARPQSRWSPVGAKFSNPAVPNFLPPEYILFENGQALDAFVLRASMEDAKRLTENNLSDQWFLRRDGFPTKLEAKFNAQGQQINTHDRLLQASRSKLMNELMDRHKKFQTQQSAMALEKDIVKKIYFTPEQFENKIYGAILGARGSTHQKIEKETHTKIVLAGKGITDAKKASSTVPADELRAMLEERPHCRITAKCETDLQQAVEKIEWIISDEPRAIEFRDENRRNLAIINGTYSADTWDPYKQALGAGDKKAAQYYEKKFAATTSTAMGGRGEDSNKRPRAEDDDLRDIYDVVGDI